MDSELVIENLKGGFRNYGYVVTSEPAPGGEAGWLNELRDALQKVEDTASALRTGRWYNSRYRGRSVALINALHRELPVPGWGIEIDPRFAAKRAAARVSAYT